MTRHRPDFGQPFPGAAFLTNPMNNYRQVVDAMPIPLYFTINRRSMAPFGRAVEAAEKATHAGRVKIGEHEISEEE